VGLGSAPGATGPPGLEAHIGPQSGAEVAGRYPDPGILGPIWRSSCHRQAVVSETGSGGVFGVNGGSKSARRSRQRVEGEKPLPHA
jgi:hypothetical protein